MIVPDMGVLLVKGHDRCYPYIADICTYFALTSRGIQSKVYPDYPDAGNAILACRAVKVDVVLPLSSFADRALNNHTPDQILLLFGNIGPPSEGVGIGGIASLTGRVLSAIFSLYVERGTDWLRRNIGSRYTDWPPTSNFCRIVRNAIVHGGTINLDSKTAVGGEWRHLKYDYRHNRKAILNDGDLSIGDLIVLMLELEKDLIDLKAPVDLG